MALTLVTPKGGVPRTGDGCWSDYVGGAKQDTILEGQNSSLGWQWMAPKLAWQMGRVRLHKRLASLEFVAPIVLTFCSTAYNLSLGWCGEAWH